MKKMSEGWKIAIFGLATAIILTIIFQILWPKIDEYFFKTHPDTHIFLIGQEATSPPIASKVTFIPVKFPEGIKSVVVPASFEPVQRPFPPNTKLYKIFAENRGDGKDTNIKIDIDFTPNHINSIKIYNEEKVKLIRGGKAGSTIAEFEIEKLLSRQQQDIEILVEGNTVKSFNALSDSQHPLSKIFLYELAFEPLVEIVGQRFGASIDGICFEFDLHNKGTRILKHGEIHLEWHDKANDKNRTNVIQFDNIPPDKTKSGSTICKSQFKTGEYFYHNVKIKNIRYDLEGAETVFEHDIKGSPLDYYMITE